MQFDEATSGLQALLKAQELSQERQAKTLLNLARQAEAQAETQATWAEKQERRDRRQIEIETQKEKERRIRAEQSRMVSGGCRDGCPRHHGGR